MSYDEKIEQENKSEKQDILQNWLNDEWILPQLCEKHKQEFRSYETSYNNQNQDLLNKKLLMDIFDDHSFPNFQNSVACQLQKDAYLKAHKDALKLEQHQKEINRKQLDTDFLEKNKLIWQKSQQTDQFRFKKVQRIEEELDTNLNKQTIFNLELQFTQDNQSSEIVEFDINAMKQKNKNEIDELLQTLIERKDQIEKLFLKKLQILEEIEQSKNKTTFIKQNTQSLQQQVQQLETLFEHINDQNLRDQLIQDKLEMQQELDQMEKDWEEHKASMQADFEKFMKQKELKKEKQMKLKIKLQNIDEDYEKLLQNMFSNENQIQNLQEQYKKATKDITRSMYLKKIKDINSNLQKQRIEFEKIQKELQDIQKSIQFNCTQLTRVSTEIENIFMMDPKRNDSINKLINNIYNSFKSSFETTFENSKEMQKVKLKARELEVKLDQLLGKNYKENSEKITVGLDEIQKENKQMEKLIAKKQKAQHQ